MKFVDYLYDKGARYFHLCNSLNGTSGKKLLSYSLRACEDVKNKYSDNIIIGGGGITGFADIKRYKDVGAAHMAIGSFLFNPFNWYKIKQIVKNVNI